MTSGSKSFHPTLDTSDIGKVITTAFSLTVWQGLPSGLLHYWSPIFSTTTCSGCFSGSFYLYLVTADMSNTQIIIWHLCSHKIDLVVNTHTVITVWVFITRSVQLCKPYGPQWSQLEWLRVWWWTLGLVVCLAHSITISCNFTFSFSLFCYPYIPLETYTHAVFVIQRSSLIYW